MAAGYRELRAAMVKVWRQALARRDRWANSEDECAAARAVAYQSIAGLIQRGVENADLPSPGGAP